METFEYSKAKYAETKRQKRSKDNLPVVYLHLVAILFGICGYFGSASNLELVRFVATSFAVNDIFARLIIGVFCAGFVMSAWILIFQMGELMDRPDTDMAGAVEISLAMPDRQEAIAFLVAHRVPDCIIARLLSLRPDASKRRAPD